MFPKIGVPQNEPSIFGVPLFLETPLSRFIPPRQENPLQQPVEQPAERIVADRMSRSLRRFISSNFTDGQRNLDDVGSRGNPVKGGQVGGGF